MRFTIQAACGCHPGRIRSNNEDNFCFDGKCLKKDNNGLPRPLSMEFPSGNPVSFAVFDGMGGENFGEYASFAAARQMLAVLAHQKMNLASKEAALTEMTQQLNDAVFRAQKRMFTDKMGSTMVSLHFSHRHVYACNVGDSRAYLCRDGVLRQLSVDHVEQRPGRSHKKAPLNRHLGFDPDEIMIEPSIAKELPHKDDVFLLCSDGVTDMLTDEEICGILRSGKSAKNCVQALVDGALEMGGRDNITAIVCKVI